MSNMLRPARLKHFFCYNPTYGPKEGQEHMKVLYYYPEDLELDTKVKAVGLSEGFVNFTRTFEPTKLCEFVHTQKTKHALLEVEPDFWMVMIIHNPSIVVGDKAGAQQVRWLEHDVDDLALKSLLEQVYRMFKLFWGPITRLVDEGGPDVAREKLSTFCNAYLKSVDISEIDMFTTLNGIHFLPVDKNIYLRIQCFVNLTENTFPQIKYTVFLFKDQLVWSGLEQEDMRTLYRYLTKYLQITTVMQGSSCKTVERFVPVNIGPGCGFVIGPPSVDSDSTTPLSVPRVCVGPGDEVLNMVVFQRQGITCVFLLDDSKSLDVGSFQVLHHFISPQMDFLAPAISEYYARKPTSEELYRFIYFNHMNLALKSTLKQKTVQIADETVRILNEMHTDFETSPENITELMVRTASDRWIVGKKVDQREVFVVFDDKKQAAMVDIQDEVRKLNSTCFGNIFLD